MFEIKLVVFSLLIQNTLHIGPWKQVWRLAKDSVGPLNCLHDQAQSLTRTIAVIFTHGFYVSQDMKDVEANVVNFGRDQSICSASNSLILVANAINLIRWDGHVDLLVLHQSQATLTSHLHPRSKVDPRLWVGPQICPVATINIWYLVAIIST